MSRLRERLDLLTNQNIKLLLELDKLRNRSAVRRALGQAEEQLVAVRQSLTTAQEEIAAHRLTIQRFELQVRRLEAEVRREQVQRVSAQRGLVAYMREHGLGDRIGYDPDQDPSLTLQ